VFSDATATVACHGRELDRPDHLHHASVERSNSATCDKWDMEVKTTAAHTTWGAGFGTSLNQIMPPPTSTTAKTKNPYDVSAYSGDQLQHQVGLGTAPPVWFELATLNNQPVPDGSIKTSTEPRAGRPRPQQQRTESTTPVASWSKTSGPAGRRSTFVRDARASLSSRFHRLGLSNSAVNARHSVQATDVLGLQFAGYTQLRRSAGTFDVIVDDVAFYTGSTVWRRSRPGMLAKDGAGLGSCKKPTGATMESAHQHVRQLEGDLRHPCGGNCVMRPENANDVVSEGIAYGMLIAVNMNDKTLFDALWSYEQGTRPRVT